MLKLVFCQMRIKQYTKNLLVFAAPLFAGRLLDANDFLLSCRVFILFCFTASIVYILNDIIDVEKDRQHPENCKRPIASGAISMVYAMSLAIGLFFIVLLLLNYLNKELGVILGVYLVMNFLYSWRLKHVVIVDVMIISFGFVLRALAGGVALGVEMTSWFILCVFMLSLFLALTKRRHELIIFERDKGRQRKVLQSYSLTLFDQLLMIVTSMVITSYSVFASQVHNDIVFLGVPFIAITIPMVIYGMFRYLYLVHIKKIGGKPEEILFRDKHILGIVLIYVATVICIRDI